MLGVLWGIAHELDRQRTPANKPDGVWLEVPSQHLRNPEGRTDNFWLRQCLNKLMGVKLEGEYRGDPWGAVILAEWEIKEGGSLVRLFIPPAAVTAIRSPDTFARIEMTAAYRLKGHSRRLYAALADKKRQSKKTWHEYSLDADFRRYVLLPAIDDINEFGTVSLKFSQIKRGRSIVGVRFDWSWKNLDEARVTDEENDRHKSARRKTSDGTAPPLIETEKPQLTSEERAASAKRIMEEAGYKR